MKILCVSNYYSPFYEGGYEISVKETMDYMESNGHTVYVLCGTKGIPPKEIDIQDTPRAGIPHRVLDYIDYVSPSFQNKHQVEKHNYRRTMNTLRYVQPDLIYFGNMKGISIAPILAVQKQNIPRVFDIGDLWPRIYLSRNLSSIMNRFLKRVIPGTIGGNIKIDPVIVPSRWMKSELVSTYGSKHVFVIPRGIALPPCQIRHSSKPLRFVFAGRIEPLKGLDLIITAAKKLVETIPEFALDIYGDGDEEYLNECREKIKKSSMEMHFNFLGRYHDVSQILPQYDVLLMPTLAREAFGRIIIEAMAARLIVIATDAYGPSEIISSGTDGFLFKRGSVQSLTDAVLAVQALDIQKLDSIRNNARRKVEEQYEITLVKKRVQHLIEEIAKNPKRGIK